MEKNIEDIRLGIDELLENDITHPDLGVQNDFSLAENIKNEICNYQKEVLNDLISLDSEIPDVVIDKYLTRIQKQVTNIQKHVDKLENISGNIHNQNFPNQRQNILDQFENFQSAYKQNLFEIDKDIRLFKHDQIINENEALENAITNTEEQLQRIDENFKKSKETLGDIRDLSLVKSLEDSAGSFDKLRSNHSTQEEIWRNVFIGSLVGTLVAVIVILYLDFNTESITTAIADSIKKLLIISIPALLTKISLKKYNLERNLKIVYDHRSTVLEQYKSFENSIGDDQEAKNNFRLEIAKYIFSDPQTGYVGNGQSSDVSVNPIINLAERFSSQG